MVELVTGLINIEPLNKNHDRTKFSCATASLDRYLKIQASQDMKRRISRVFVATTEGSNRVVGFYTLSSLSVAAKSLPTILARKLPRHPLPTALIGRLAVDSEWQGKGLGKSLLVDALSRMIAASHSVAIYAAIVDAQDDRAATYYEKFGFERFKTQPLRLYLPLALAERLTSRV